MAIVLGEWSFEENMKKVKGSLEIPEFSFGELDDLEVTFFLQLLRILRRTFCL